MSELPTGSRDDPFGTFDAAYVLGALSPADRAAFEQHLQVCQECARSVRELAGLPGLLAHAQTGALDGAHPPAGLGPRLVDTVRQARRRRRVTTVASAVVAVMACAALLVVVLAQAGGGQTGRTPMSPLGRYPVEASAMLVEKPWGTQVDVSCHYLGGAAGDYVLVAIGHDGSTDQVARWTAFPSDTARLAVGTALARADIRMLELRTASGTPLLRWNPSE